MDGHTLVFVEIVGFPGGNLTPVRAAHEQRRRMPANPPLQTAISWADKMAQVIHAAASS